MRRTVTPRFLTLVAAATLAIAVAPLPSRAQCTEHANCLLPQSGCVYFVTGPIAYPPTTVLVRNVTLESFTQCMVPLPPGNPIDSFFDVFVELQISPNNGGTWQSATGVAHGHEHAVGRVDGITFDTEMLQLDLSGGSLPPGVMLRESPTLASTGQTVLQNQGGGNFHIDSFFDVFTELSLDGGNSWTPSNGSGHPTVVTSSPTPLRQSTWGAVKLMYR